MCIVTPLTLAFALVAQVFDPVLELHDIRAIGECAYVVCVWCASVCVLVCVCMWCVSVLCL